MRRRAGHDDAGDAAGFRRANQRPEIARILDVDRGEDETGVPADLGRRRRCAFRDRDDARPASARGSSHRIPDRLR